MRLRTAVFGGLGALLTLVAAATVLLPDLLLSNGPLQRAVRAVGGVEPTAAMLAASGVVGLYLAVLARSADAVGPDVDDADRRFHTAATTPPEAVTADRRQLSGAGLDAVVDRAVAGGGPALAETRETLRATAAMVYAERAGVSRERARGAVGAGEWTDDPVAAAFLAGDGGPAPSLRSRVRLWLLPERERERRVERALGAIEALEGEP